MNGNSSRLANSRFAKYYMSDRITWFEWFIAVSAALLVFCSTAYSDLKSLTIWSTNIWDVTLDSNIFHLYEYSAKNVYGAPHQFMGSELMSVLPWSIWNLPIWIAQRFFGKIIVKSPLSLAWSKLFLVVLSVVLLYYTYKICMLITGDRVKSRWCMFFTASSFPILLGVCYAGQNDILMITASVIAIYYMISDKSIKFLIWSAIAISIKPFFLLAFIAVLLLKEKNVIKIILYTLVAMIGIFLQKLMFYNAPMYEESMNSGPSVGMIKTMFPQNIKTAFGPISFFAIALVVICFYAYTRNFSDSKGGADANLYSKYIIYIINLVYFSYLIFSPFSYYRIVLLVPFLYIMICVNPRNSGYGLLLETVMSFSILMELILKNSNFCRLNDINYSLFQRVVGYRINANTAVHQKLYNVLANNTNRAEIVAGIRPLFSSIAMIAAVMLLVLCHPQHKVNTPKELNDCPRILIWVRALIIVPFILAILYMFTQVPGRIY
ncbi:MAG: hypothetical protein ACI4IV_04055 [Acutalibacteraceae bacterium]